MTMTLWVSVLNKNNPGEVKTGDGHGHLHGQALKLRRGGGA